MNDKILYWQRLKPRHMDNIWKAFLRNLSNPLSLLSILITLYFGFWYVPDWIDDVQKQKIAHSERLIEQSVKELIYSDTVTTYVEIELSNFFILI